jgi:hypothetical protein
MHQEKIPIITPMYNHYTIYTVPSNINIGKYICPYENTLQRKLPH